MKPERIQDRWSEKPEWTERPAALERRWPCEDFLQAAGLARLAHTAARDAALAMLGNGDFSDLTRAMSSREAEGLLAAGAGSAD